jgi:hypothetical protein
MRNFRWFCVSPNSSKSKLEPLSPANKIRLVARAISKYMGRRRDSIDAIKLNTMKNPKMYVTKRYG